jgi:RsiW-degrading membrane proteinase PrsW (M82 family)
MRGAAEANPGGLALGLLLALPSAAVYAALIRLLDRYDPEPGWALACVFAWGAVFATGVSAAASSGTGPLVREVQGVLPERAAALVLGAPFVEELTKGLAVAGLLAFLRREFDGAVDGVVYGTLAGIGFAAVENVVFFARASAQGTEALTFAFVLRSVLTPWTHPLYTSLTGLGLGIAREATRPAPRVVAPLATFVIAVALHALWNAGLVASGYAGVPLGALLFPLWVYLVATFVTLVLSLVERKGALLRHYLEQEVARGTLTADELAFVSRPWARGAARRGPGGLTARAFVRTAGRLAMAHWHADRAAREGSLSQSGARLQPLRDHLAALRAQLPPQALR